MKIPLPDSVTGRYAHTVSSFVLDPNHVFLIIVGGAVQNEQKHVGGGVMKWFAAHVTDPNITMVVELVFNDGQWSVGPVLDSVNIPLLYEVILKERKKKYMTDKEKELQVINESLRHDLQVARINNQSLQEALLETQSLSEKRMLTLETQLLETKTLLTKRKRDQEDSPHSDNCKKLKTDELEESVEEKQIMTGEYDKHKAIVADNELHVYITEVLKEKTQVEERLNEKQIIIDDFKTTVSEKDAYISKLLKEKSQQQERITSQEEQSIKETSSVEVQFNYLIPSMDNFKKLKTDELEESVEEKQIMTGEYEKLNAIVTDNEVYITELLEEKTQVEEQLKEKQIIINDFKTTVFEKDAYISKLVKEKSQQQERITFQEEQSIKETSSVEVQFNYLIPSMGKMLA
ncbi:PREDICTED: putative leucine-rich repeat-containing protein DDB_G0290503, partial [Amphimedon queenslandica]|uniref:Uncharacterized protein n=1 Tax=Amphimedon queenslandica TaxID=400682 RepID=A0AAN0JTJ3_AMPQE